MSKFARLEIKTELTDRFWDEVYRLVGRRCEVDQTFTSGQPPEYRLVFDGLEVELEASSPDGLIIALRELVGSGQITIFDVPCVANPECGWPLVPS